MRTAIMKLLNNTYLFFSTAAPAVDRGVREARAKVADHKLDEAVNQLRDLLEKYPSDWDSGPVGAYLDELYDSMPGKVRALITDRMRDEVSAIVHGGKDFFKDEQYKDIRNYVDTVSKKDNASINSPRA